MASTALMVTSPRIVAFKAGGSSSSGAARAAAAPRAASLRRQQQQGRKMLPPVRAVELMQLADGLDLDWSDTDTQIGALGAFLGLALGIGAPMFYAARDDRDEERLEELRALNRATKDETGEYLSEEEIAAIRPPRWTDRREFVDND